MRDLVSALVRQRPGFVVVPNVVDIPQIAGSKHPTTIRIRGGVCSYRSPQSPSCLPCLRCDGRRGWNAGEFVNRARVGGVVCGLCCVVLGMESIRSARVWKLLCGLCSSFFACYVGPNPPRIFPAWPAELNLLGAINLPEPYMIHTYTYPH